MTPLPGTIPGTIYKLAVLIDTGPLYALADPSDGRHIEANKCVREITRHRFPLFITNLVVAECHRRVLHNLGSRRGLEFLASIHDGRINIVCVERDDSRSAREILERHPDQAISLTDATSLAVMARLGIVKAFSFDRHFDILGFLRIPPIGNLLV